MRMQYTPYNYFYEQLKFINIPSTIKSSWIRRLTEISIIENKHIETLLGIINLLTQNIQDLKLKGDNRRNYVLDFICKVLMLYERKEIILNLKFKLENKSKDNFSLKESILFIFQNIEKYFKIFPFLESNHNSTIKGLKPIHRNRDLKSILKGLTQTSNQNESEELNYYYLGVSTNGKISYVKVLSNCCDSCNSLSICDRSNTSKTLNNSNSNSSNYLDSNNFRKTLSENFYLIEKSDYFIKELNQKLSYLNISFGLRIHLLRQGVLELKQKNQDKENQREDHRENQNINPRGDKKRNKKQKDSKLQSPILVWSDGGEIRDKPLAYGIVIKYRNKEIHSYGRHNQVFNSDNSTRAEALSIYKAILVLIKARLSSKVILYNDNLSLVNFINGSGFIKDNFILDNVLKTLTLCDQNNINLEVKWVKGHQSEPRDEIALGNIQADELVSLAINNLSLGDKITDYK
jgi:ribonuclease HI